MFGTDPNRERGGFSISDHDVDLGSGSVFDRYSMPKESKKLVAFELDNMAQSAGKGLTLNVWQIQEDAG